MLPTLRSILQPLRPTRLPAAALAFAATLLAFAALAPAKPGVLTTKDGRTLNGDITEDDEDIEINIRGVKTRFPRAQVAGITYGEDFKAQYEARMKNLAPDDGPGRVEVARWAFENRQPVLAQLALEEALKINPGDEEAKALQDTIRRARKLQPGQGTTARPPRPRNGAGENGETVRPPRPPPRGADADPPAVEADVEPVVLPRPLTPEEVNRVRQLEWRGERGVRVRLANGVKQRYLDTARGVTPAEFNRMKIDDQAYEILTKGKAKMAADVEVLTDPPALREYRTNVQRIILTGCAAEGCHAAPGAGGFVLHTPASDDATALSNFIYLQQFNKTVRPEADEAEEEEEEPAEEDAEDGGIRKSNRGQEYWMIDRTRPESSLLVQYGLPASEADVPHPKVDKYRGIFKTTKDPKYRQLMAWMGGTLAAVKPEYKIDVFGDPDAATAAKPNGEDAAPAEAEEGAEPAGEEMEETEEAEPAEERPRVSPRGRTVPRPGDREAPRRGRDAPAAEEEDGSDPALDRPEEDLIDDRPPPRRRPAGRPPARGAGDADAADEEEATE